MVKISEIKVGQVIRNEFDKITRELLKKYAKASGDTNPIHTSDVVAEKAGLKGIIAHGLFSFGFITKLFEDFLNQERDGKIIKIDIDMVGMVRCGDLLVTEATISKIENKRVFFDIKQTTLTNVDIKKGDNIIKQFEAGERGYISEKDIARGLLKKKEVEGGILTYRERVAMTGNAIIELRV
ncbi:MAG: MaoC family dehydratase [Promethearchaeota archaeon]